MVPHCAQFQYEGKKHDRFQIGNGMHLRHVAPGECWSRLVLQVCLEFLRQLSQVVFKREDPLRLQTVREPVGSTLESAVHPWLSSREQTD